MSNELEKFSKWLQEPAFPLPITSRTVDNGTCVDVKIEYEDLQNVRN